MCGIAGIIDLTNKGINQEEIKAMTDIISHRGPDGEGFYFNENFAFGHRRLAIIDLSDHGKQPMHYSDRYVITFNGEIYNYIELREQLISEGYSFNTNSDTEVLLASYDFWKEKCLEKLNGMWSFAIFDKEKSVIFCARDRFGIKPFYYTQIKEKFCFGSEIKEFTTVDGWRAFLNRKIAVDYLSSGISDHSPETMFEGVYQLMGGHYLLFDLKENKYHIKKYYDIQSALIKDEEPMNKAKEKFRNLLKQSIKLRLRSDVKIGTCLSGGLDSSSIVVLMNSILKEEDKTQNQETISSCFRITEFSEDTFINEVVKSTGVVNIKVYPQIEDLLKVLDSIIWHQDEPFGSTSIFAQWTVFRAAHNSGITVMLDGQGADETLAGYLGFFDSHFAYYIHSCELRKLIREMLSYKRHHNIITKELFLSLKNILLPERIKAVIRGFLGHTYPVWLNSQSGLELKHFHYKGFKSIKDKSLEQLFCSSLPHLLRYEDRNSMAHSIEARLPFLDYQFVEYVLSLPEEYKIQDGATKVILRKALKGILPDLIINRHDKMGFVTPEVIWLKEYKNEFISIIEEAIVILPELINKKAIKLFDDMVNKKIPFSWDVWRIICFVKWIKRFNVKTKLA